ATAEREVEVAPWSLASWELLASVAVPADPAGEVITVAGGPERAWWYSRVDRELRTPAPAFDVTWHELGDGRAVATVTARSFVRDLVVEVDRVTPGWQADRQLVTLLPGERAEVTFTGPTGAAGADAEVLVSTAASPPVWWAAGNLAPAT